MRRFKLNLKLVGRSLSREDGMSSMSMSTPALARGATRGGLSSIECSSKRGRLILHSR